MHRFLEKIYITLKLIQICRQNEKRQKFCEKYNFDDYGEDLDNAMLVKCTLKKDGLYKGTYRVTGNRKHTDDFGITRYVHQEVGYCEDDYHGTIYRKIPLRNIYIRTYFEC